MSPDFRVCPARKDDRFSGKNESSNSAAGAGARTLAHVPREPPSGPLLPGLFPILRCWLAPAIARFARLERSWACGGAVAAGMGGTAAGVLARAVSLLTFLFCPS